MSQAHFDALKAAGLEEHLLCPGDASYEERVQSWWSAAARLRPSCIFRPKTPEHVSKALSVLSRLDLGRFAIRSGGHSVWAGGSNVDDGLTIDLGHLNQVTYHKDSGTVSLGPGQRWGTVYEMLEPHGVVVAGGRIPDAGVGGLVTGGGISFYAGRSGFACDTVVNFQVVLADGRIVDANVTSNSDLWKALKGGSGNLGIVTRIDMEAFQGTQIWGGSQISDRAYAGDAIRALVNFSKVCADHPGRPYAICNGYDPLIKVEEPFLHQILVDVDGVVEPPVFKECRAIPAMMHDLQVRSMAHISNSMALPSGRGGFWLTLTTKVDARIMQKSVDLHEAFIADMSRVMPATDFVANNVWQLMPSNISDSSVKRGGNVLGLDAVEGHYMLWVLIVMTKSSEFEKQVHQLTIGMKDSLGEYAASVDGLLPWQYLNYADATQNPLKSYGPENLAFLRQVSQKYDPSGFFQTKFPGGFTLARAG
ncbi:Bifunctional solanapyrone synthase [Escovopsis weberi]|uniref:Bifunctional solanapyrone synthase n=1 Tax=Escovopsis weberi TaxID=150374 RepID=A0A0M8NA43_ESCWE|nr:Bifunctional solanapyrone synthase [Escovopsis weberi]